MHFWGGADVFYNKSTASAGSPALVSRAMDEVMVVLEAGVQTGWGMVRWPGRKVLVLGLGRVPATVDPGLR